MTAIAPANCGYRKAHRFSDWRHVNGDRWVCGICYPPPAGMEVVRPEFKWWERRMLAFDLETTAPEPTEARIVSAAAVLVGGGEPTVSKTWLVDPGVPIPEGATAVHGITTEKAQAEGVPAAQAVREIVEFLIENADLALVIFNARYDLTVMAHECRRHGIDVLFEQSIGRVVDPHVIDKTLHRYRKGSRKLDATCDHYGAVLGSAHDADFDALAAARLAWVLGKKGWVVRRPPQSPQEREEVDALRDEWARVRHDLDALHDAQVVWAAEQAAGLADHFRRQGQHEDAAGVRTEWPIVPFEDSAEGGT